MPGCRKIRGWLAASLYEALDAGDQARLDRHLSACAACREHARQLRALRENIPVFPVDFSGDLLPVLRQRITEEPLRAPWWRWALPVAACTLLAVFAGVWFGSFPENPPAPAVAQTPMVVTNPSTPSSPADTLLAKADTLREERDFMGALGVLAIVVKTDPRAPQAAEAQLRMADIEFSELQRYPQAYEAYESVRNHYPDVWNLSPPAIKDRFDLLSEACGKEFEPLYALDAARREASTSFQDLEQLVVRYPGSLVASLAVGAMCEHVAAEPGETPVKTAVLQKVRERCRAPIAIAQVDVALGDAYWRDLHEPQKAREYYTHAAGSPHAELARMARAALTEIDNMP